MSKYQRGAVLIFRFRAGLFTIVNGQWPCAMGSRATRRDHRGQGRDRPVGAGAAARELEWEREPERGGQGSWSSKGAGRGGGQGRGLHPRLSYAASPMLSTSAPYRPYPCACTFCKISASVWSEGRPLVMAPSKKVPNEWLLLSPPIPRTMPPPLFQALALKGAGPS